MAVFKLTEEYCGMSYVRNLPYGYHIGIRKMKEDYLAYLLKLREERPLTAKKRCHGSYDEVIATVKQWVEDLET